MRPNYIFLFLALACCISRADSAPQTASDSIFPKFATEGNYKDSKGGKHPWQVNDAHSLVWDGVPYLPVGGAFAPHSFLSESDEAWQEDIKTLQLLKTKSIHDLIIWPGKPIPEIKTASIQRLIDYLEANDFAYGLGFGKGITRHLTGFVVRPTVYRYYQAESFLTATWQVENTDGAVFALVDIDNQNQIARAAAIAVNSTIVTVPVETPKNGDRVYAQLYPHKFISNTAAEGGLPDLWSGFDEYRDRVLNVLGQVKFGRGLRFFHDPLAHRLSLADENDFLVPDSPAFRLEWEAYLAQNYTGVERIREAWSMSEGGPKDTNGGLKTMADMARLIPLWEKTHGVPYFYDPQLGHFFRINEAGKSNWWADFIGCRNSAIQYYMNTMADILKKQVAEVPVVYTWTDTQPIFLNKGTVGGYDGLSIVPRSHGSRLMARTIGPAYSQVEQNGRNLWCLATEMTDTNSASRLLPKSTTNTAAFIPADSVPQASGSFSIGYASAAAMGSDIDTLRRGGFKGFYASGFQTNPDESAAGDWLTNVASLDWLHDYSLRIQKEAYAARFRPRILYFPENTPGPAEIGIIPNSTTLWLSSPLSGESLDWWPSYSGYSIGSSSTQTEIVLKSLQGRRETHFLLANPKTVQAFTPDGQQVPIKIIAKNQITVMMDSTPIIFRGVEGNRLIPKEAAEDTLAQLEALYTIAFAKKISSIEFNRKVIDQVRQSISRVDFENAYVLALGALNDLTLKAQPYTWREGEQTSSVNTFDERARNTSASGGAFLTLSNHNDPPARYGVYGYGAYYDLDIPRDGNYDVWISGSLPGPGVSPIIWHIDTPPDHSIAEPNPHGPLYLGERFGWMLLGKAKLTQGQHTLKIFVPERAPATHKFNFSIDTIMVTQNIFSPNGAIRPVPVDAITLKTYKSKAREKRL